MLKFTGLTGARKFIEVKGQDERGQTKLYAILIISPLWAMKLSADTPNAKCFVSLRGWLDSCQLHTVHSERCRQPEHIKIFIQSMDERGYQKGGSRLQAMRTLSTAGAYRLLIEFCAKDDPSHLVVEPFRNLRNWCLVITSQHLIL